MPRKSVVSSKSKKSKTRKPKVRKPDAKTEIKLAPPWNDENDAQQYLVLKDHDSEISRRFISERTRLHEKYVLEEARIKRWTLVIACILFLSAIAVILFAPEGRQNFSYWIGGALFVMSAGAAGYKKIWAKTKNKSIKLE
jgi:hypothetical protein